MLNLLDLFDRDIQCHGHRLMHFLGIIAFDKVGRPPVATQQLLKFLMLDAGQHRWVGNFVAVEMQDRQHRAVG